jgi:hypothetical protein
MQFDNMNLLENTAASFTEAFKDNQSQQYLSFRTKSSLQNNVFVSRNHRWRRIYDELIIDKKSVKYLKKRHRSWKINERIYEKHVNIERSLPDSYGKEKNNFSHMHAFLLSMNRNSNYVKQLKDNKKWFCIFLKATTVDGGSVTFQSDLKKLN